MVPYADDQTIMIQTIQQTLTGKCFRVAGKCDVRPSRIYIWWKIFGAIKKKTLPDKQIININDLYDAFLDACKVYGLWRSAGVRSGPRPQGCFRVLLTKQLTLHSLTYQRSISVRGYSSSKGAPEVNATNRLTTPLQERRPQRSAMISPVLSLRRGRNAALRKSVITQIYLCFAVS